MSFNILHANKNNYLEKSLINVENTPLFKKKNEIINNAQVPLFLGLYSASGMARPLQDLEGHLGHFSLSHIQVCDVILK